MAQDKHPDPNADELRQRFNPDGSLLRRQQLRMLDLLCAVDRMCVQHGIPYWLSSGTLLGAARHKGFIPWDDDLDIEMRREDYLRLLPLLQAELPGTMALQTHDTDPNYFSMYAKVRDRRSRLAEANNYDRIFREQGIYIDIFPFERQPLWLHLLSEKAIGHAYKILRTSRQDDQTVARRVRRVVDFNVRLVHPLLRALCRVLPGQPTYALGIPYHDPRRYADIFPLTTIEFEGRAFPAPRDTEAVLTLKYGDWRTLPDLSRIAPHVGQLIIED